MEYYILYDLDIEDRRVELDESDIMMVREFQKILNFYKKEKTVCVCYETFMDIFNFFATRNLDVEATLLCVLSEEW